jgi:heptosyltransferase-1
MNYSNNIIDRNTSLIGFALGMIITKEQIHHKDAFIFSKNKNLEIQLSSFKKNIILIPGASHVSKCYSPTNLAELTTLIDANFFIVWGSDKEKKMANQIKEISKKVNICNHLQLDNLLLLISRVDLVIGPDTGPTHAAWAMNIPSITLFGSTPGYRNSYSTAINKVIESYSKVDPKNLDKNDFSINKISPQEIAKTALDLLH